jgi:diacylglycerol kinase
MRGNWVESVSGFLRSRAKSFRYAFTGWGYVIRTQRNAWIHALFSLITLGLGIWLRIGPQDLALIILTIALVWTAEFLNTALEAVVDLASPQHHPLAKVGKDVGAAAVLIAALASVLIGLLVLGPPLLSKLGF